MERDQEVLGLLNKNGIEMTFHDEIRQCMIRECRIGGLRDDLDCTWEEEDADEEEAETERETDDGTPALSSS
jgi:hypothetical protein